MRTLDVFHAYDESVELIVVLPVAQQGYWNELCREYDFRIPYHLADGGETRFHSVANGLAEVPDGETDALVAVHDGVRPFVSREVIAACYESAFRERAAIPVVEVVETLSGIQRGGGRQYNRRPCTISFGADPAGFSGRCAENRLPARIPSVFHRRCFCGGSYGGTGEVGAGQP